MAEPAVPVFQKIDSSATARSNAWGGEAPKFANEEQARLILSTIMARYNEIAAALETEPDELDPVFWEDRGGAAIAADWAEGFREAIELRSESWTPLFQDAEASPLLVPILALCGDEDGSDLLPIPPDMRKAMLAEAPELIPVCVFAMRRFWRKQDQHREPYRATAKLGRNMLCPCGSGANTSAAAGPVRP